MQPSATKTSRMNVRAMQAKGALCLAAYCAALDIRHPAIAELLSHLLDLQASEDLSSWEQKGASLDLTGRGDPVPGDLEAQIPPSLQREFTTLVEMVVEIGMSDIYAAPSDSPARFLQKSAEILERRGIEVPNVSDLLPAHHLQAVNEDHWGGPISEDASAAVRKCCRELMGG